MKKTNVVNKIAVRGFTLIELLVVVLIIGILAAVALPQYQKAVEKARIAEATAALENLEQAIILYRLEHGVLPTSITELNEKGSMTITEPVIDGFDVYYPSGGQGYLGYTNTGALSLVRNSGKYAESRLTLWFYTNYEYKEAQCLETKKEFCEMAVTFGYHKRIDADENDMTINP